MKIRKASKILYFDVANAVKDAELAITSIPNYIDRSERKLNLRKKMLHQGTLTPAYDKKFWMYILKSVGNDVKA